MRAAHFGHTAVVSLLLKNKANVQHTTGANVTALQSEGGDRNANLSCVYHLLRTTDRDGDNESDPSVIRHKANVVRPSVA